MLTIEIEIDAYCTMSGEPRRAHWKMITYAWNVSCIQQTGGGKRHYVIHGQKDAMIHQTKTCLKGGFKQTFFVDCLELFWDHCINNPSWVIICIKGIPKKHGNRGSKYMNSMLCRKLVAPPELGDYEIDCDATRYRCPLKKAFLDVTPSNKNVEQNISVIRSGHTHDASPFLSCVRFLQISRGILRPIPLPFAHFQCRKSNVLGVM